MQFDTFWGPIHEGFIGKRFAAERRPQAVRGATRRGRSPRVAAVPLGTDSPRTPRGCQPRMQFDTFWGPIHEAFIGNQFATEQSAAVRGAASGSPRMDR